jgi:hypothetical protein
VLLKHFFPSMNNVTVIQLSNIDGIWPEKMKFPPFPTHFFGWVDTVGGHWYFSNPLDLFEIPDLSWGWICSCPAAQHSPLRRTWICPLSSWPSMDYDRVPSSNIVCLVHSKFWKGSRRWTLGRYLCFTWNSSKAVQLHTSMLLRHRWKWFRLLAKANVPSGKFAR